MSLPLRRPFPNYKRLYWDRRISVGLLVLIGPREGIHSLWIKSRRRPVVVFESLISRQPEDFGERDFCILVKRKQIPY